MNVGEKIRIARTNKGMTQEELGKALGVQKSAIAKYENGRVVNIKRSTLKKISDILGIAPSELIFESYIEKETPEKIQLNEGEEMLLDLFRRVPVESQQMVLDMIKIALKQSQ